MLYFLWVCGLGFLLFGEKKLDNDIYITHNLDEGYVYFRCDRLGINCEIDECIVAKLTLIHLQTGEKMINLVKKWQNDEI